MLNLKCRTLGIFLAVLLLGGGIHSVATSGPDWIGVILTALGVVILGVLLSEEAQQTILFLFGLLYGLLIFSLSGAALLSGIEEFSKGNPQETFLLFIFAAAGFAAAIFLFRHLSLRLEFKRREERERRGEI